MSATNPPSVSSPAPPPSAARIARTRKQQSIFLGGVAFVVFSSLITRRALARRYKSITTSLQPTPTTTTPPFPRQTPPTSAQAPGYSPASISPKSANNGATAAELTSTAPSATSSSSSTTTATGAAAEAIDSAAADLHNSGPMVALEALSLATLNVISWAIMVTGGALYAFDISSMDDLRRKVRGGMGVDGTGRSEQDAEEELEEWLATVLARKEEKSNKGIAEKIGELRNERGRER